MCVGFGSTMFHGTLLYEWQMADEIPMVWSILCWLYAMFLMESVDTASPKHTLTTIFAVLYSVIYSVMHYFFAFTITFQLQFGIAVALSGYILHKNCLKHCGRSMIPFVMSGRPRKLSGSFDHKEIDDLYTLCRLYVWALLAGFAAWIFDQAACDVLHSLPFGIPNPQLHAWWHVLIGFNCHIGLQLSIGLRQKVLSQTVLPTTKWYGPGRIWPITNRGEKAGVD